MKKILVVLALFFSTSAFGQPSQRPLTRGLADSLYVALGGGSTIAGTTTFNNVAINGTCTGIGCGISGVAWGSITGTLSAQTDLQSALNLKAPLASPTFSGTVTGTFLGNLTGNVTGNTSGTSGSTTGNAATASASDHSPTACNANTFAQSQSTVWSFTCASVALAALAAQAANTVVANATAGSTTPTAFAMPSCSSSASALIWTTGTGFGCNSSVAASTVTTNANLTGPIASSGNTTSVTAQSGTGTTFVMNAGNPVITSRLTVNRATDGGAGSLYIGAGSTSTNTEQVRLDSGSGAGGWGAYRLYRNGVDKALIGVEGGAGTLSTGSAADDLIIRSVQKLVLSFDNGTTLHGSWTPTGLSVVGTLTLTGNSSGQCTLNGAATATCTHTVPSGCIPVCIYNSSTTPHTIACAVSSTTLTAVSATTLDGGTVNYHCF